jgi:glycine/D-amino acid oxidase-like deaminating enzyme
VAVIGCGALGMTSALMAQKAGANVTIYAKDRMPDVRSARATGSWTPDSRVSLADKAAPDFPALWEKMARIAWKEWRGWLSLPGYPVEWTDRYALSDIHPDEARARRRAASSLHFGEYAPLIRDLTPTAQLLPAGSHPFPTPYVQRNSSLTFNVHGLGHQLITDFLLAGGKIVRREFNAPSELTALKEKVVINCTGYGARALWKDETVRPVRGQIAWLIPQPEVNYGLTYNNVTCLSRRDGIVLQASPLDEAVGIDDTNETPIRAESEAALAVIAGVYARMKRA